MENIAKLRKKTGLSQKQFSDKYHLSVRTLQQWEQGISKPLDSLVMLISKDIENSQGLRFKYKPKNTNVWKICIEKPFLNCERVYPIQQRKVNSLINDLTANNSIDRIIIFGSSVTDRCHIGADVDIYVESEDDIKLNNIYDFEYDLWTNKSADERLKKEISSKGVIVYGKN